VKPVGMSATRARVSPTGPLLLVLLASCSYSALRDGPGTEGIAGDDGSGASGSGASGAGASGTGASGTGGGAGCQEDFFACGVASDCCSGMCTEGQCGAPLCNPGDPPLILAEGYEWPYGLALYGSYVYFPDYDGDGGIYRVPRAGGPVEALLAPSDFPSKLVVDDQGITIAVSGSNQIQHLAFGAVAPTALASGLSGPTDIALDETHVYFVSHLGDTIGRVPRGGGQVETVGGSPGNFRLTVTDEYVYWGGYDGLMRSPKEGGLVELMSESGARTLTAANGIVFWTEEYGPSVVAFDESTGAFTTLATMPPDVFLDGITVDETDVFFTAGRDLWRVSRTTGEQPVHIATTADDTSLPSHVVVDGSCVYWSENFGVSLGRVTRAPKY